MDLSSLISIDPSLRQIVLKPTRGQKILDVIVTNLASFYQEPTIIPAILPDISGHGAPSDHYGVCAIPISAHEVTNHRTKLIKLIRPVPESLIPNFEAKLENQDFQFLHSSPVPSMVDNFQSLLTRIMSETFPEKRITITPYDQPWFTEELRKLRRARQRRYVRHGKDDLYLNIKRKFDLKLQEEIFKYKNRIESQVRDGKRGSSYPALRKLGARPYESDKASFQLPEHIAKGFSAAQSAEIIAEHFSEISREFAPLEMRTLPQHIQSFLNRSDTNLAPILSMEEVRKRIIKAKKPHSTVPGDLPRKLVQRCATTLANPVSIIFNRITQSAVFPPQWKTEHQIAIPKIFPPSN